MTLFCLRLIVWTSRNGVARGDDKEKISIRKSAIQQAFKKECGLLIDVVKQGVGTTNDGNTARRFFRDAEETARITGIRKDLIERFHVILHSVASGERVSNFSEFFRYTAELYVNLYPWYYICLPVSINCWHMAVIYNNEELWCHSYR